MENFASLRDFEVVLARLMDQEADQGFDFSALDDCAFGQLALALFRLQVQFNECYRRFVEYWEKSNPKTPAFPADQKANWRQIPCVPTSAFKEFEITSLPKSQRFFVFQSSGTAGQNRSRHFHSPSSLALYEKSLACWFFHHFPLANPETERLFILTPPPIETPNSSLVHMLETVRNRQDFPESVFYGRLDAGERWGLDAGRLRKDLREAGRRNCPAALLGTAFNFVQLLDALAASRQTLTLPPGSRLLETGGYKGQTREMAKTALYRQLEDCLGIPFSQMISEYGMSELSSQAYDGRLNAEDPCLRARRVSPLKPARLFHFPPWARCQIIAPETGQEADEGETGLIRVFDLANVWSVMAVQTEDLGRRLSGGIELLGRAANAEARGCSLMPQT